MKIQDLHLTPGCEKWLERKLVETQGLYPDLKEYREKKPLSMYSNLEDLNADESEIHGINTERQLMQKSIEYSKDVRELLADYKACKKSGTAQDISDAVRRIENYSDELSKHSGTMEICEELDATPREYYREKIAKEEGAKGKPKKKSFLVMILFAAMGLLEIHAIFVWLISAFGVKLPSIMLKLYDITLLPVNACMDWLLEDLNIFIGGPLAIVFFIILLLLPVISFQIVVDYFDA